MNAETADTVWEATFDAYTLCSAGDGCPHLHRWDEHHPYGMGTAAATLCECVVPDVEACPGVQAWRARG